MCGNNPFGKPVVTGQIRKPDFLLIGAQKSGTSWLWEMLGQHPETDLPPTKEIHYFGSSEHYAKGPEWYYAHFEGLDQRRLCGEASTSYLFDRVPFWFNESRQIEYDPTLSALPALVHTEIPDAKVIAVLRDPVHRALSAYRHWMKKGNLSPLAGLRRTAVEHPRLRILEYGQYCRHLRAWRDVFPSNQMLVLIFEEDVVNRPRDGLRKVYEFLDLDQEHDATRPERRVHGSWSWTRSVASYYSGPFRRWVDRGRIGDWLDRHDFMERFAVRRSDIAFLRDTYESQKTDLESLLGRSLDCWDYGKGLMEGGRSNRSC